MRLGEFITAAAEFGDVGEGIAKDLELPSVALPSRKQETNDAHMN